MYRLVETELNYALIDFTCIWLLQKNTSITFTALILIDIFTFSCALTLAAIYIEHVTEQNQFSEKF